MSRGSVRKRRRKLNEGQTDIHEEGGDGRKIVVAIGLIKHTGPVVRAKQRLKIDGFFEDFFLVMSWFAKHTFLKVLRYRKLYFDIQHTVKTHLSSPLAYSFEEAMEKLLSRYEICLRHFGNYVEK